MFFFLPEFELNSESYIYLYLCIIFTPRFNFFSFWYYTILYQRITLFLNACHMKKHLDSYWEPAMYSPPVAIRTCGCCPTNSAIWVSLTACNAMNITLTVSMSRTFTPNKSKFTKPKNKHKNHLFLRAVLVTIISSWVRNNQGDMSKNQ